MLIALFYLYCCFLFLLFFEFAGPPGRAADCRLKEQSCHKLSFIDVHMNDNDHFWRTRTLAYSYTVFVYAVSKVWECRTYNDFDRKKTAETIVAITASEKSIILNWPFSSSLLET